MNFLKGVLGGEQPIDPKEESALDTLGQRLWNPFPAEAPISTRQQLLSGYLERQQELADELLSQLGIETADLVALDKVWAHFLATRKLVKSSYKVPRYRRRHGRGDFALTHREDLATLLFLEGVGALLGVMLQRRMPSLEWRIGHDESGSYMNEGLPILCGFPGDFPEMNPTHVVLTIARRSIDSPNPHHLSDVARQWIQGKSIPGLEHEELVDRGSDSRCPGTRRP